MCTRARAGVHTSSCRFQGMSGVLLHHPSPYSLEIGSVMSPGATLEAISSLDPPGAQGRRHTVTPGFYVGAGGLPSGSHSHVASAVTTKLSLEPLRIIWLDVWSNNLSCIQDIY